MARSFRFEPFKQQQPVASVRGSQTRLGTNEDAATMGKQKKAKRKSVPASARKLRHGMAQAETVERFQEHAEARGARARRTPMAKVAKEKATSAKRPARKAAASASSAKRVATARAKAAAGRARTAAPGTARGATAPAAEGRRRGVRGLLSSMAGLGKRTVKAGGKVFTRKSAARTGRAKTKRK